MAIRMKLLTLTLLIFIGFNAYARPNTNTIFNVTNDGYTRAQIINNTPNLLACYVAIDGFRIKFRLRPLQRSIWYKATDTRFNYKDFSSWCDYIENHPEYT